VELRGRVAGNAGFQVASGKLEVQRRVRRCLWRDAANEKPATKPVRRKYIKGRKFGALAIAAHSVRINTDDIVPPRED
jgi:hypothetical protein